jgi:hypothetical protein
VEFCKDAGIIDGYEDGTFHPYRNLTTDQWLKMLLTAIGFDANKFGLTGKDWAVNTAEVALKYDLVSADEYKLSFDREVAILYAYNALKFQYGTYQVGVNVPLAESVFGLKDGYKFNNYGAPTAHVFTSNGKEIASIEVKPTSTATNATYTIGTSDKGLTGTITYVEDGQKVTNGAMGGNSATVAVYEKYDGTNTRVVVVNTLIAEMTKSNVEKFDKVDTAETLKIGDIVIYTQGNTKGDTLNGDKTIETAQRVTAVPGTVTDINRNSNDKWVNVDGVEKVAAAKYAGDIAALATNIKYNFYYDNYGNIVCVTEYTEPAREGTLVFLLGSVSLSTYDASDVWNLTTNDTYQAKYIDLSTAEIVTADANLINETPVTKANLDEGETYAYDAETYNRYYWAYANEDGTVDFEAYQVETKNGPRNVTYGTATINEVANDKPTVTLQGKVTMGYDKDVDASGKREFTTDSNTKLTVITYTGAFENLQITTTTGYSNFKAAEYTAPNTFATSVSIATNVSPTDIYVIAPASAPEQTTAYMMYIGEGVDHAVGGQEYYFVDSYGVKQTLTYDQIPDFENTNPSDGVALEEGTVYKLTLDSADVFTAAGALTAADDNKGQVVKADTAGYLSLDNIKNYYIYDAFCGRKAIATDGSVVSITVKGQDAHGCAVAGTNVELYLNELGQIAFITAEKPAANS